MTVLITVVLPPGGDAGPFDLYSNTDGYVVPFATNISASALIVGYTATNVPNGTTTIRVQSVGVCTNFINVQVNVLPTTTTTSSTSTSSTSTTTTTSTTAVPTTTTTSSSSTSTSTSTSTTTTCPCYIWDVSPTAPDVAAGLILTYTNCDGNLTNDNVLFARPFERCIQSGSTPELTRNDAQPLQNSTLVQTSDCCTSPPPQTTTTSTTLPIGNLIVENESYNLTVNDVTSTGGSIVIESVPPETIGTGSHSAFGTPINVDITLSNAYVNCMSLFVNGQFRQKINITGTAIYSFAAINIFETDIVRILIVNLACPEPE
jgi:hypothetical protein